MNNVWAVLFVVGMTILGKWLLFDEDAPLSEAESLDLRIADETAEPPEFPLSKSA